MTSVEVFSVHRCWRIGSVCFILINTISLKLQNRRDGRVPVQALGNLEVDFHYVLLSQIYFIREH